MKDKELNKTDLSKRVTQLEKDIYKYEDKILELTKKISKVKTNLREHIDRQTAEIRVVEDDGEWGDYTGVFYVDPEDEKKIVLDKAYKHYKNHFEHGVWYKKKTLGLFLNTVRGKVLIEILKATGNEIKEKEIKESSNGSI